MLNAVDFVSSDSLILIVICRVLITSKGQVSTAEIKAAVAPEIELIKGSVYFLLSNLEY